MPTGTLTGTRIRERRLLMGVKQSALARQVGISASYLNLIEHNRRKIAGKLLADLALALQVEPSSLAEGAGAALVEDLREAAARFPAAPAEDARAEEFAGRFPGWARLVAAQAQRIAQLEATVETLSDRMEHDPNLAASLHELLSTVTAISSTASILVEPGDLEPAWRERFHRNIHEDSTRLAEATRALVTYLEADPDGAHSAGVPQDDLVAWLECSDYHVAPLERDLAPEPEDLVRRAEELKSAAARSLAVQWLRRYRRDAQALPLSAFQQAVAEGGVDPVALCGRFDAGMGAVLRRIAALPTPPGAGRIGLALCDASGTLTFRKQTDDFPLPRYGAACPLWPLYQALGRPLQPVRAVLRRAGRDGRRFLAFAVAEPLSMDFDAPPVMEAAMLIVPSDRVPLPDLPPLEVGSGCRACPRPDCAARREPSILSAPPDG